MKKLFAIALAALTIPCLRAGEESSVKNVFTAINSLACELKLSEALRFYTDDFVQISPDGKKITKNEARQAAAILELIGRENPSITEIMTASAAMRGRRLSDEELAGIREMEKSDEGRQQLRAMRDLLKRMRSETLRKIREQAASFRFVSARIDGDRAAAVYREKNIENGKMIEHTCKLVKKNGKWLIAADNGQYVGEK